MARCFGNICGGITNTSAAFWRTVTTISCAATEGTYLVWIDCRAPVSAQMLSPLRLQEQQHLMVNSGTMYRSRWRGLYPAEYRLSRALLADGLERMARLFYREVF